MAFKGLKEIKTNILIKLKVNKKLFQLSAIIFFFLLDFYFVKYGDSQTIDFQCNKTLTFANGVVSTSKVKIGSKNVTITDINEEDEGKYQCGDDLDLFFNLVKGNLYI